MQEIIKMTYSLRQLVHQFFLKILDSVGSFLQCLEWFHFRSQRRKHISHAEIDGHWEWVVIRPHRQRSFEQIIVLQTQTEMPLM